MNEQPIDVKALIKLTSEAYARYKRGDQGGDTNLSSFRLRCGTGLWPATSQRL